MAADRKKRGLEINIECMGSGKRQTLERIRTLVPAYPDLVDEFCWGTVWDQPGLDKKIRSLITIAAATAQNLPREVGLHTRGALNHGAIIEEITQTIIKCVPYTGIPKVNHAFIAAMDVFDQWDEHDEWKSK